MAKPFEVVVEQVLEATPEQAWEAISTGQGMDGWFMGTSEIEPRLGGAVRTALPGFTMESTITAWDPPRGFTTSWHPGYEEALATRLRVRFVGEGPSRTRVELEHDGWEVHGPAAEEKATDYLSGWVPVLARFVERAAA